MSTIASITCLSRTRDAVSDEADPLAFAAGDFSGFFPAFFFLSLFAVALDVTVAVWGCESLELLDRQTSTPEITSAMATTIATIISTKRRFLVSVLVLDIAAGSSGSAETGVGAAGLGGVSTGIWIG